MLLGYLGDAHAAVVLQRVDNAAGGDTRHEVRILDGATEDLVMVEETRRNVFHLARPDEVRAVDAGLVTAVIRVGCNSR